MSISNIQKSSPDVREGRFSRTSFLRFCGWAAILGVVSAALANLIASGIVEDYSMVSQSISALAAGERSWIQDLGLYILAVGIAALALGLGAWQSHHRSWMMGVAALSLIALDIVAIGFFHGYAKEDVSGTHLHTYAVYALGLLFAATASLAGISLRRSEKRVSVFSFVIWFLWILSAPFFFLGTEQLVRALRTRLGPAPAGVDLRHGLATLEPQQGGLVAAPYHATLSRRLHIGLNALCRCARADSREGSRRWATCP